MGKTLPELLRGSALWLQEHAFEWIVVHPVKAVLIGICALGALTIAASPRQNN